LTSDANINKARSFWLDMGDIRGRFKVSKSRNGKKYTSTYEDRSIVIKLPLEKVRKIHIAVMRIVRDLDNQDITSPPQ